MPDTANLNTILDAPPQWTLYVSIGVLITGAILWLLGRKLARPACAIGGLLFGGISALLVVGQLGLSQWLFALVVVAGVAGCLMAWFLFRLWMGLSAAIILGLAIPAAVLVVQGIPASPQPAETQEHAVTEETQKPLRFDEPKAEKAAEAETEGEPTVEAQARAMIQPLVDTVREVVQQQVDTVREFWDGLGPRGQWTMLIAATAGASFGLIMGLIAPYFAATIQTALVGGLLILSSAIHLSQSYMPDQARFLPTELRGRVLLLGLITLAGIGVQWTLSAKRTDK